ncbi:hypothetical protein [Nocardiopsis codii]|uniref:hypothetical protein n=1 Tax=Nocardiopsis codii TaxID=3065942 RepID=UPI002E7B2792|nr:hypothetical protein [Nocardiopsis sp. CT-R113]
MTVIKKVADFAGQWFALLVLVAGVVGLLAPGQAAPLAPYTPIMLGVIMFGVIMPVGYFASSGRLSTPDYTPRGALMGQF